MNKNARLTELDVLRGLAALSVVLYHYTYRYDVLFSHSKPNYFLNFSLGHLGVQLFFIISGLVIFMTLERCIDVKEFAFKRAIRLYPAYIVAVILTFTLVSLFGLEGREVSSLEAFLNLTLMQGFFTPFGISHVDGVYWSLAVELIFYIIMGFLFVLGYIKKIENPLVIWLTCAFIVRGLNLYFDNFAISGIKYYGILSYCNLFIAGIMFYKLRSENKVSNHIIILACLAYEFCYNGLTQAIVVLLFFAIFYLLIYGKLSFINNKPLAFLGTISYSLYLVHQNIGYIIINFMEKHGLVNEIYILVPIIVSIILGTVLTFYVEKPIQNLIRKRRNVKLDKKNVAVNVS